MRFNNLLAAGASLGVALVFGGAGCALEPGNPWGVIEPQLDARLALPAGRVDTEGRIRTVDDYRVELTQLDLSIASVSFVAGESAALSFDPSDPPPGYTLCHGGHCHADDGRLVDYAIIAAELAGGGGAGATVLTLAGGQVGLLGAELEPVPLEACQESCEVGEPVAIGVAQVTLTGARIAGAAFDSRTGDAARLGPDGQSFDVALDFTTAPVSLAVVLGESFGPGREPGLRVRLELEVSPTLFDGIPWSVTAAGELSAVMAEALAESLTLQLGEATRFEL